MREQDFPELEITYLDSACMSLRPETVIRKVEEYYREYPACTGRSSHQLADKASKELADARKAVASLIDAEADNLTFTSGTTEGINTVAKGFEFENVVLSDREHNSNLVPWQKHEPDFFSADNFEAAKLDSMINSDTIVSTVHVSNLDGYEVPLKELSKVVHENDAYLLVDAAQSIPHQPFSIQEFEPDFVAFSGHKMLGPSGTGGLYVADRVKESLSPLKSGGGAVRDTSRNSAVFEEFPQRMEAGLPNLAGFIGLGEAANYLQEIGMKKVAEHEDKLTRKLRKELKSIDGVKVVGKEGSGIESFRVEGVNSSQVAQMLDRKDIAVRSGMHCLHTMHSERDLEPSVRASLHLYNNASDIEKLIEELKLVSQLS